MRIVRSLILSALIVTLIHPPVLSQISAGGKPVSFQRPLKKEPPVVVMPQVDVEKLLAEDSVEEEMGLPFRFGFAHEVNLDLNNSGVWETLDDGGKVWRLAIRCPGAYSINLIYNDFELPPGARLHLYSQNRRTLIGAFTEQNNEEHRKFATTPITGEMTILEYYLPPSTSDPGHVSIDHVVHGYKPVFFKPENLKELLDFNDAGECNINVNCPEGLGWGDEIRSVALITLAYGTRLCSGALVNNVRQDSIPYFLTANHCVTAGGSVDTWVIIFNYESPTCENIDGPLWMSVAGTTLRANHSYSDFALLELSSQPPDSYNVFYAGWAALDEPTPMSVGIHHPMADIKKISFNDDPLISSGYLGEPGDSHWEVDQWELGTTEPGSSGSPLFNENHLIVGQLSGGFASCTVIGPDYYGKLSKSWDYGTTPDTRLKDWLDPDNTGTRVLRGLGASSHFVNFVADTTLCWAPHTVNFTGWCSEAADAWMWDFGDGGAAYVQSPSHTYTDAGIFSVRADVLLEDTVYSKTKTDYIYVLRDTLVGDHLQVESGSKVVLSVRAHNLVPLDYMSIPLVFGGDLTLTYDSFSTLGCRTEYFAEQKYAAWDAAHGRVAVILKTSDVVPQPELESGEGDIIRFHFTVSESAELGQTALMSFAGYLTYFPLFDGSVRAYEPKTLNGSVTVTSLTCCAGIRGNVDDDPEELIGAVDVMCFVDWLFEYGVEPACFKEADVDGDGRLSIRDATYLVQYVWLGGPLPMPCSY